MVRKYEFGGLVDGASKRINVVILQVVWINGIGKINGYMYFRSKWCLSIIIDVLNWHQKNQVAPVSGGTFVSREQSEWTYTQFIKKYEVPGENPP